MSAPKYLLRWRYEYANKLPLFGMWSSPGAQEDLPTKAWPHNTEGMIYAVIEAKDFVTREISQKVRVPKQDFRNFQWIAAASIDLAKISVTHTKIAGLKIQTRDKELSVFEDGSCSEAPFQADNINFKTYGI